MHSFSSYFLLNRISKNVENTQAESPAPFTRSRKGPLIEREHSSKGTTHRKGPLIRDHHSVSRDQPLITRAARASRAASKSKRRCGRSVHNGRAWAHAFRHVHVLCCSWQNRGDPGDAHDDAVPRACRGGASHDTAKHPANGRKLPLATASTPVSVRTTLTALTALTATSATSATSAAATSAGLGTGL